MKVLTIALALTIQLQAICLADYPVFLEGCSAVCGYMNWGADWWQMYREHRYAEVYIDMRCTQYLANPTYLNIVASYSQSGLSAPIDVYIDTMGHVQADMFGPYNHGGWWNWHTMSSGGYYVGRFETYNGVLASFNIDTWINTHTASTAYCIAFDQLDDPNDQIVLMAWLGPQGHLGVDQLNNVTPMISLKNKTYNKPNPFNKTTTIVYHLLNNSNVDIDIYNITGQKVRQLVKNEWKVKGEHFIDWDCKNEDGHKVPQGTYIYNVNTNDLTLTGKLMYIQ
jgi:hypothetical protein